MRFVKSDVFLDSSYGVLTNNSKLYFGTYRSKRLDALFSD